MKRLLFVILFSFLASVSFANHTKGGWMYYEYLGPGTASNTSKYKITLKQYTECELTPGQSESTAPFTFFNAATNVQVLKVIVPITQNFTINNCTSSICQPCINNPPDICYRIRVFELVIDLPNTASGYIVAYQRCCRIIDIVNLQAPSNNFGETWTVKIPGTAIAGAEKNSSAIFAQNDTAIICHNNPFTFDFSAADINNDSLVYSFTPAFTGGGQANGTNCTTCPSPDPSAPPPFATIPYVTGYSGFSPLGPQVTINSQTGIVSGIAPAGIGIYVITVLVSEYRRGTNIKIAEVRKSLHIEIADCSTTAVMLKPDYTSCDGFTVDFKNLTGSNIQTYYWDFGDGTTSTQPTPTHTYADTGIYILKLVANRGLPCSDSATAPVKVYPGFFPDFDILGQCQNFPIQFLDKTNATYGAPNKWNWNFGDLTSPANTSILKNPMHTYSATGTYSVKLVVYSDKGCYDSIVKPLDIFDRPALTLQPKDTLICNIDTLQLNAIGAGSFFWTPNYMISNVNIPDPLVSPDVTTTYRV